MTYCLAIQTPEGLVFASDSRTSAGVDYVTTYNKLHVMAPGGDRVFVVLSSGNLATTQEILLRVARDVDADDARPGPQNVGLQNVGHLFEAAGYLGRVSRAVQEEHGPAVSRSGASVEATLIVGGQIRGQAPGVYLVYPQGNFIHATTQTPFLQIGEVKYGKPMLDRFAQRVHTLDDAARLALVSLDATMRSNVSVGPPFELAIYATDALRIRQRLTLGPDSEYFRAYREAWERGLAAAFAAVPRFDWEGDDGVRGT